MSVPPSGRRRTQTRPRESGHRGAAPRPWDPKQAGPRVSVQPLFQLRPGQARARKASAAQGSRVRGISDAWRPRGKHLVTRRPGRRHCDSARHGRIKGGAMARRGLALLPSATPPFQYPRGKSLAACWPGEAASAFGTSATDEQSGSSSGWGGLAHTLRSPVGERARARACVCLIADLRWIAAAPNWD